MKPNLFDYEFENTAFKTTQILKMIFENGNWHILKYFHENKIYYCLADDVVSFTVQITENQARYFHKKYGLEIIIYYDDEEIWKWN